MHSKLPSFLTQSMLNWLNQYYSNNIDSITSVGLFIWHFSPNKRNINKPNRRPSINEEVKLNTSTINKNIYFHEVDNTILHVYQESGFNLAGSNSADEFIWDGNEFIKMKNLFYMIS
ncbi:hypothetical protein OAJ52_01445 [Bacteroidia bacterium]|jgi:hypothetical protein|nr:hypothetical protein [Bacteroidia bacterium]|tara:strand:- start:24 stop:374 length:351 start_codon:yes stop_codon:yes gene_type:complete